MNGGGHSYFGPGFGAMSRGWGALGRFADRLVPEGERDVAAVRADILNAPSDLATLGAYAAAPVLEGAWRYGQSLSPNPQPMPGMAPAAPPFPQLRARADEARERMGAWSLPVDMAPGTLAGVGGAARTGRLFEESTRVLRRRPSYATPEKQQALLHANKRAPRPKEVDAIEAARAQVMEKLPEARRQIEMAIEPGQAWSNIDPIFQATANELGPEAANAWLRGFAARLGPTSIQSKLPKNTARALWSQNAQTAGIDIGILSPSGGHVFGKVGHPYYHSAMKPNLERMAEAEFRGRDPLLELDPFAQHKIRRLGEMISGNLQNTPTDIWETRFWFGADNPTTAQWKALEDVYRKELAPAYGLEPSQVMAARWVGGAQPDDVRGMMSHINDQLSAIAKRAGMSESEAFKKLIRGEFPVGDIDPIGSGRALKYPKADLEDFVRSRDEFIETNPLSGYVADTPLEEIKGKAYMNPQRNSGFVIADDGDLQMFHRGSNEQGEGVKMMRQAIRQGASKLDAFDGFLPRYYRRFGMVETGRVPWDPRYAPKHNPPVDEPDVVFMKQSLKRAAPAPPRKKK